MTTATCHTEGCANAAQPIDVTALLEADPAPDYVACGVCGEIIEDVSTDG